MQAKAEWGKGSLQLQEGEKKTSPSSEVTQKLASKDSTYYKI